MLFLGLDQRARVLLECDVLPRYQLEQIGIEAERDVLGLQRLAQDLTDVVLVRLEQRPDREGRVAAEPSDHLARLLSVRERLRGFRLKPCDDRDPAIAENHHRVVRVPHDARELAFEDAIQLGDDLFLVEAHDGAPIGATLRGRSVRSLACTPCEGNSDSSTKWCAWGRVEYGTP